MTMPPRHHPLDNRIPPPLVGLLVGAGMAAAAGFGPTLPLSDGLRHGLSGLCVAAGIGFDLAGLLAFRKARTTVNPLRPSKASAMVTGGVYRFTRNPMYVGLLLLLLAWALHLSAWWPFAGLPLFVLYIGRFQIAPEERALRILFGTRYDDYAARVRRWL
jgi:protein-S-isoprenylcysteine O-methyltransferase Ste14